MEREFLRQIYLQLSLAFLLLLIRLLPLLPPSFADAILSCTSLPVAYALTLIREVRVRRYVKRRGIAGEAIELLNIWLYEFSAVLLAFIVGYVMYIAFTGYTDIVTFSLAFATALLLRVFTVITITELERAGIDPEHPAVIFAASFLLAASMYTIIVVIAA